MWSLEIPRGSEPLSHSKPWTVICIESERRGQHKQLGHERMKREAKRDCFWMVKWGWRNSKSFSPSSCMTVQSCSF